jgi:UDP-glucose 4-epimerase
MLMPGDMGDARIVVFGGAGFLGGRVVAESARRGATVVVADLREPETLPPGAVFVRVDALDIASVTAVVDGADAVFAFAGGLGALGSVADPLADLRSTCEAQLILLDAVEACCPDAAVVLPGSRLEYGAPVRLPVDEGHPLNGTSPYALHKSTCAGYYRLRHQSRGLHTVVLRLSNPYGPRVPGDAARAGFGVLNVFVDKALAGETIPLYGGGEQLRDFVHVNDVVEAALLAASTPEAAGLAINIGSGEPISLAEAAHLIVEQCGMGAVDTAAEWPHDAAAVETGDFYFDIGRARAILGYAPSITFAEGVAGLVASIRKGSL